MTASHDWYDPDPDLWDGHGWYDPDLWDYEPVPVTCNRCGKRGLAWDQHGDGRWHLYENSGRPHTCHEITPNITKQLRKLTP